MYDFKMLENEKIKNIFDEINIKSENEFKEYSIIVTNKRILFMDYPSNINNSMEDLRIINRFNYIRKKIIKYEFNITEIKKIIKTKEEIKLYISNDNYISIKESHLFNKIKKSIEI